MMAENDRPFSKFGEWDVNDPASLTVIFNKAWKEKMTCGNKAWLTTKKDDSKYNHREVLRNPPSVSCNLTEFLYRLPL